MSNESSFIMYANRFKNTPKHPDLTGKLTDETGKEYRISAWINTDEANQMKSITGRIQPMVDAMHARLKKESKKDSIKPTVTADQYSEEKKRRRKFKNEYIKTKEQDKKDNNSDKVDGLLF